MEIAEFADELVYFMDLASEKYAWVLFCDRLACYDLQLKVLKFSHPISEHADILGMIALPGEEIRAAVLFAHKVLIKYGDKRSVRVHLEDRHGQPMFLRASDDTKIRVIYRTGERVIDISDTTDISISAFSRSADIPQLQQEAFDLFLRGFPNCIFIEKLTDSLTLFFDMPRNSGVCASIAVYNLDLKQFHYVQAFNDGETAGIPRFALSTSKSPFMWRKYKSVGAPKYTLMRRNLITEDTICIHEIDEDLCILNYCALDDSLICTSYSYPTAARESCTTRILKYIANEVDVEALFGDIKWGVPPHTPADTE